MRNNIINYLRFLIQQLLHHIGHRYQKDPCETIGIRDLDRNRQKVKPLQKVWTKPNHRNRNLQTGLPNWKRFVLKNVYIQKKNLVKLQWSKTRNRRMMVKFLLLCSPNSNHKKIFGMWIRGYRIFQTSRYQGIVKASFWGIGGP